MMTLPLLLWLMTVSYSCSNVIPKWQVLLKERRRRLEETRHFKDPLNSYIDKFNLESVDMNVYPVWYRGITGKNVTVCILDFGFDISHGDLKRNVDTSFSRVSNVTYEWHGNAVAGLVASVANNSLCSHGVAYNANLVLFDYRAIKGAKFNHAINKVDIYSSSWGHDTFGVHDFADLDEINFGATFGRDGKGAIYVMAAGNNRRDGNNCGAYSLNNNPNVITIGALNWNGQIASYSQFCSAVRATLPTYYHTTSIRGQCKKSFAGTSAACPLASGCFALALEQNPNLTNHDLMYILAISGRVPRSVLLEQNFQYNGAGFTTSSMYGSGLLDCDLMVNIAAAWTVTGQFCQVSIKIGTMNRVHTWYRKRAGHIATEFREKIWKMVIVINKDDKLIFLKELKIVKYAPKFSKCPENFKSLIEGWQKYVSSNTTLAIIDIHGTISHKPVPFLSAEYTVCYEEDGYEFQFGYMKTNDGQYRNDGIFVKPKEEISVYFDIDNSLLDNSVCLRHCEDENSTSDCRVERLETVSLEANWITLDSGAVNLTLTSPSGTVSELLYNRKDSRPMVNYQLFSSAQFYGEDPIGIWKISMTDSGRNLKENMESDYKCLITGLKIILYGTTLKNSPLKKNSAILNKVMSAEAKIVQQRARAKRFDKAMLKEEHEWGVRKILGA